MRIVWTPLTVSVESQKDGEYADARLTVVVSATEAAALLRMARADREVLITLESRKRQDEVASLEPNTGPDCQIEGRTVVVLKPVSREEDQVKRAMLVVRFQFSAAHHLPHHDGVCGNLHGHTWRGELVVSAPVDETTGMAIDFSELKEVVDTNLPDHLNLNDSLPSPTCENVAELLVLSLQGALPRGLIVKEITLWESDRCGVRVTGYHDPGPVLVPR